MTCGCNDTLVLGQSISWPIQLVGVNLLTLGGQFVSRIVDASDQYVDSFSFTILDQNLNLGKALMTLNTASWLTDSRVLLAGQIISFDLLYQIEPNDVYPEGHTMLINPRAYLRVESSPTLSTTAPA